MSFYNKVILITGAGSGIGAATAVAFAKQSAIVSIVDINEQDLNKTAEVCKTNNKEVLKIVADLTRDEDIKRIVDDTIAKFGKLDVLVNCAGMYTPAKIESNNLMKIYDRILAVNLRSIVALTNYAVKHLIEAKGSIVSICSVSAKLVTKNNLPYSISKAGLMHFTKCAAIELAEKGVRVNSISPGVVKTNIFQSSGFNETEIKMCINTCIDNTPLGAMIQPEEIADVVLFLSSDKAKNITGSDYLIDGGMLLNGLVIIG
ncbi:3-oxoacyl-[acyl-carrier-protein] reductase FabG [Papilio machaon]|uniref:3-oxoacyl-[acyl-carrier-protein] reductase FabG n=1 Tax=Papilio machaon TaxID=76193 RepID=UPI001E665F54|nr:3-oxoacyl-[acyl-carrier-protein] reductase FabG [Papilio machaon]